MFANFKKIFPSAFSRNDELSSSCTAQDTTKDPETPTESQSSEGSVSAPERLQDVDKKFIVFAGYIFWATLFVAGGVTAAIVLSQKKPEAAQASTISTTMSPSMPPSMYSSMPPTMHPSPPPSLPPTLPPTPPPSLPPTLPPTMSPTIPQNSVLYDDRVTLQVQNQDGKWLSGGRGEGGVSVSTDNYYAGDNGGYWAYHWIVRNTVNNDNFSSLGKREYKDPMAGQCVRYGDRVFLQISNQDNKWLRGGLGGHTFGVLTHDMRGQLNSIEFQWIIRKRCGDGVGCNGDRTRAEKEDGQCLKYNDVVYLQNNSLDNRWLTGGRGDGNKKVLTGDTSEGNFWAYQWKVGKPIN